MANFTRNNIDNMTGFEWFQVIDWKITSPLSSVSVFTQNVDGTVTQIIGTGFTFDSDGNATGGIVSRLVQRDPSNLSTIYAEVDGLAIKLATFQDATRSVPTNGFLMSETLLGADDTIAYLHTGGDPSDPFGRGEVWTGDGADTITQMFDDVLVYMHIDGEDDHIDTGAPLVNFFNQWVSYEFKADGSAENGNVFINLKTNPLETSEGAYIGEAKRSQIGSERDLLESINHVKTGGGDDTVLGSSWLDATGGGSREGTIAITGDGDDQLLGVFYGVGGEGDDTLRPIQGGKADPASPGIFQGSTLLGEEGDDVFIMGGFGNLSGNTFFLTFDGGADTDTLRINFTLGAFIELSTSGISTILDEIYTIINIENIEGGIGKDTLFGDGVANHISGENDDDFIMGFRGNDTLVGDNGADLIYGDANYNTGLSGSDQDSIMGGAGEDTLVGNAGSDTIEGGEDADDLRGSGGNDEASYRNAASSVSVSLFDGIGTLGDANGDTLSGFERLAGSDHDDTLVGDDGENTISGRNGRDSIQGRKGDDSLSGGNLADLIRGGGGNDTLDGGKGQDSLFGDNGDDVLDAGDGVDTVVGGDGNDTIVFATGDDTLKVQDFTDGDRLDLSDFGLANFAAVESAAQQDGAAVKINLGGTDRVVLRNFQLNDLDAGDLILT